SPPRRWRCLARSASRPRSPTSRAAPSRSGIPSEPVAVVFSSRSCMRCVASLGDGDWPPCASAAARGAGWSSNASPDRECGMRYLNELERQGLMSWRVEEHAWVADPERVVRALTDDGFQEYKREIAKDNRSHAASGGMWQGLDPKTGVVATVIWHATLEEAHVF